MAFWRMIASAVLRSRGSAGGQEAEWAPLSPSMLTSKPSRPSSSVRSGSVRPPPPEHRRESPPFIRTGPWRWSTIPEPTGHRSNPETPRMPSVPELRQRGRCQFCADPASRPSSGCEPARRQQPRHHRGVREQERPVPAVPDPRRGDHVDDRQASASPGGPVGSRQTPTARSTIPHDSPTKSTIAGPPVVAFQRPGDQGGLVDRRGFPLGLTPSVEYFWNQ